MLIPPTVEDIDIRRMDYPSVLASRAARYGSKPYLRFEEQSYSFADVHRITNAVGNGLLALGVRQHDKVALLLENGPEIAWYLFANGKIGAVSVPLNTAAKGELLARFLRQSGASCVVVGAALIARLADVAAQCPDLARCVVVGEAGSEDLSALSYLSPQAHQVVMGGSSADPGIPVRFSDPTSLMFTSGTSGPSKANISTHAHSFAPALALARAFGYGPEDVLYTCLPLFHGNAMRSLFVAMACGCSVAVARRFSASGFWEDVRRFGATQFNLLGAMANILWARLPSEGDRAHGASKCMIVPMPAFARDFTERFGVRLCSTYALTDFSYVSFLSTDDPPEKWASAGRVQPDIEAAILDEDDFPVPPGGVGEICLRPRRPWVAAQGYYAMPEATVTAWRNLWFHTGDRGTLDADGYLFFVDRKKDAIRRRGENISSYEVEQILVRHPAVLDVAVYAVASELSEDEVMASLVLRDGATLTEADLVRWCGQQMAYFMVPRYVEFLPQLPRTMSEKIEKYKLRADAETRLQRIWDRERAGIVLAR